MPRDIPVGNGKLLVTFDHRYQIRDIYFPRVGQENHAGNGPCHFGVWTDAPGRHGPRMYWTSDPSWTIRQRYLRDTLTTSVSLDNREIQLAMYCNDVVDFHRNILVRRIKVKNLSSHPRDVRLYHHQNFHMLGNRVGDTAYFDPELRAMVHYRNKRYLQTAFQVAAEPRIDEFAIGTSGYFGAEGTWRDAEDGHLQGNPIAQGAVDSTISHHMQLEPFGEHIVFMTLVAAESRDQLVELHKWLTKITPQGVMDRTNSYWRLWVGGTNINFGNLPGNCVELFKRSLLVLRTQIDDGGAIVAANDSDIMQFSRDTYSYVWPRDGALVADSLDLAGFPDVARSFYLFCQKTITPEGYFHHKYNPDGSPASSWHPWIMNGKRILPIQEDETALVVWALWRHYYRYRDIEFIRPLWVDVVQKAADFMCRYRDEKTKLPLPSYDLWEERWGVHAFTVATVYGGLKAARNFAVCFGDRERAERYNTAAEEIKAAAGEHLYSKKLGRFSRRLMPRGDVNDPTVPHTPENEHYDVDPVIDASLYSIFKFHLFEADDPRVAATMKAVEEKLWCKTDVGGVARYERDYYHRISSDTEKVPGNPWFICTLWLADYYITIARSPEDLKRALPIFTWTAEHALASGVLAEQVNPYTNEPLSVSPLTWSHATVVSTSIKYLEKLQQLQTCDTCSQPIFHLRKPGLVEIKSHVMFDRFDAQFDEAKARETSSSAGQFIRYDQNGAPSRKISLAIHSRDCIGCDVCVSHCDRGVLRMIDDKAVIDLRNLHKCDLDGTCVQVCPTDVISLLIERASEAA